MVLILRAEFLNEHANDLINVLNIFIYGGDIKYILIDVIYNKNNTLVGSFFLIKVAIDLYDKCLYKEDLKKHINKHLTVILENKDEIALFREYVVNYRSKYLATA